MSREYKYTLPQVKAEYEDIVKRSDPLDLIDEDWVRLSLYGYMDEYGENLKYLFRSPVMAETQSSMVGMSLALNLPYSFTRYADVRYKGRFIENNDVSVESESLNIGAGRFWCESQVVNSGVRTLYMQFGTPKFISIWSFLRNSVDYASSIRANTGRTPFWYYTGKAVGTATAFYFIPSITAIGIFLSNVVPIVAGDPDAKFYSMKPNMVMYWESVTNIMNSLGAERGLLSVDPTVTGNNHNPDNDRVGSPARFTNADLDQLTKMMPNIFKNGYIDAMGIAGSYQAHLNKILEDEITYLGKITEGASTELFIEKLTHKVSKKTLKADYKALAEKVYKIQEYRDREFRIESETPPLATDNEDDRRKDPYSRPKYTESQKGWFKTYWDYYKSTLYDGGADAVLLVEHLGSATDTFSNSFKDIPLASMFKATSGARRDARFSLSDYTMLGETVKDIAGAVKDFTVGAIEGISINLSKMVETLMSGANIDFPKMWDDSDTQFHTHEFRIQINPPYGNMLSLALDIDLILSMILAGGLPMSTGRTSYTSPFLCKAFIRGSVNIDLGMIRDIRITRGGGNTGFTQDGSPTEITIAFSIVDLAPMVSAPMSGGFLGLGGMAFDDYSGLNRYLRILSGQSYTYTKFFSKKFFLRMSKLLGQYYSATSPMHWGLRNGIDGIIGSSINALTPSGHTATVMFEN